MKLKERFPLGCRLRFRSTGKLGVCKGYCARYGSVVVQWDGEDYWRGYLWKDLELVA